LNQELCQQARAKLAGFQTCKICSRRTILFIKAGSTAPATFESQPGTFTGFEKLSANSKDFGNTVNG
jgi:hypothetical protein